MDTILGAIAGDVIGSVYEFFSVKRTDFPLPHPAMNYTDDTVLTIAVADWILQSQERNRDELIKRLRYCGQNVHCPMGGYGRGFYEWANIRDMGPYNSWGNGSAMRVSACGFAFDTMEKTLEAAKRSAEVTHNHPEGIKGAQATAAAMFLARTGHDKEEIRKWIMDKFGYDLNRTCDDIRPSYYFKSSCQETVPESLVAFFDSTDYESAIRLAVSLGGDADTMGAITGAVAIAYYKEMPQHIHDLAMGKLPEHFRKIVNEFDKRYGN